MQVHKFSLTLRAITGVLAATGSTYNLPLIAVLHLDLQLETLINPASARQLAINREC